MGNNINKYKLKTLQNQRLNINNYLQNGGFLTGLHSTPGSWLNLTLVVPKFTNNTNTGVEINEEISK